jgi:hypothetical protein
MATQTITHRNEWKAYGLYTAVALIILLPLLLPGYILTLDMVFTPQFAMPQVLTSGYPLYTLLHGLSLIIPTEYIQKAILLTIFVLAAIGLHRLLRRLQTAWRLELGSSLYIASVFFAINPYTYSRFMAGHYLVLLGYSLLPWLVSLLLRLAQQPSRWHAVQLGLATTVVGIVSLHSLGLLAVLAVSGGLAYALRYQTQHARLRQLIGYAGLAIATWLITSSYWLVPLIVGKGRTAYIVQQIGPRDFAAFAVPGSTWLIQLWHILSLQGLWTDARQLYTLPQAIFPLWYVAVGLLWVGVGWGLVWLWRQWRAGAWWMLGSGAAAVCLALGVPLRWLADAWPALAGFREPYKFAGIIALWFAVALAVGIPALLHRLAPRQPTWYTIVKWSFVILPLCLTPTVLWGFGGQLKPRHYPAEWFAVNTILRRDHADYRAVFLPWHQYQSFNFSQRIIANPAKQFFGPEKIISSDDPELAGAIATSTDATTQAIGNILKPNATAQDFAQQLATHKVKYILLARELDYHKYDYLAHTPDLRLIHSGPDLLVYQNNNYKPK